MMQAYHVTYRGKIEAARDFFAAPWVMEMPPAIANLCFDIILVDAPEGWKAGVPGRMESSFYAMHNARHCLATGQVVREPKEAKL
jgi:hypothetical protein